jgi:hypothetical protein
MMWRRLSFTAAGALLLLAGCLLAENNVPEPSRQCAAQGSVDDGNPCRCDADCKSRAAGGWCYDEAEWASPHGYCYRECVLDEDCGESLGCDGGRCLPRCTSKSDCGVGRACWPSRATASFCWPHCNDDAECESGNCNLYRHLCLPAGAKPKGAGLNAACELDGQCRSDHCYKGQCSSSCDPETQRCPENGVCIDKLCQTTQCDEDAGVVSDSDAGAMCQ